MVKLVLTRRYSKFFIRHYILYDKYGANAEPLSCSKCINYEIHDIKYAGSTYYL